MKIIENKDIDFENLFRFECPANSESELFYDDNYMYKMFKINEEKNIIYLLRKKIKLELLAEGYPLDNVVLPKELIMNNRTLSGYKMDFIKNSTPIFNFSNKSTNINDFYRLMYGVSLSLRNIHNDPRNIVIGDLSISNIIFDANMKHYFVDFDSVKIDKISEDRVPFALERYARRCGIEKYDVNKNTDKFCLILAFFFVVFRKSIEEVSMEEYDKIAEKSEVLKNMREIVLEIKKYNIIPNLPYLDEIIPSNILKNKKRIKIITKNI